LDADGPRADAYGCQFALGDPSTNGRFSDIESLRRAFHGEILFGHVDTSVLRMKINKAYTISFWAEIEQADSYRVG
jgi:hypothetical protein